MKKFISLCKIIALFIFNSIVIFWPNPLGLTIIFFLMIIVLFVVRANVKDRLKSILPIALFIVLFQLIFNFSIPLDQRFIFGYINAIRITVISLSVLLFLAYTSLSAIVEMMSFLPKSWLLLLLLTFYMIPTTFSEAAKIKMVQYSRAATLRNRNYFSNIAAIIIPLLHRVFQRAEILSFTIVSRGYEDYE